MKPKSVVMLVGAVLVAIEIFSALYFLLYLGTIGVLEQVIRMALTLAMAWFLVRGSRIVKWLSVLLLGLGGILSTLLGTSVFTGNPNGLFPLIVGILYLGVAVSLLVPPGSRHFRKPG